MPDPVIIEDRLEDIATVQGGDKEAGISMRLHEEYERGTGRVKWARQAVEDDQFANGIQWTTDENADLESQQRSPSVQNTILQAKEQAIAMMVANDPTMIVMPQDDTDVSMAKVFSNLLSWHWYRSHGNAHLRIAIDEFYSRGGRGILHAFYDPNSNFGKGEVKISQIDTLRVFCDPNAKDPLWRDAKHVIIKNKLTFDQLVLAYPQLEEKIRTLKSNDTENEFQISDSNFREQVSTTTLAHEGSGDRFHTKYDVLTRYSIVTVTSHRIFDRVSSQEEIFADDDEYEEWLSGRGYVVNDGNEEQLFVLGSQHQAVEAQYQLLGGTGAPLTFHLEEGPPEVSSDGQLVPSEPVPVLGPEDAQSIPDSTVVIAPVPRSELVASGAVLHVEYPQPRCKMCISVDKMNLTQPVVLPISRIPVIPIMNVFHRNPWPDSSIKQVRPIQREINYRRSKINAWLASSTGNLTWVPLGSIVDEEDYARKANMPGRQRVYYNAEMGVPIPEQNVPLPNSLFEQLDRDVATIHQMLGVFPFGQGDPTNSPNTAFGVAAVDENATRRIAYKLKPVEDALSELGRVVIEFIQAFYTDFMVMRVVNPHTDESSEIRINELTYEDFSGQIERLNDVTVGAYDVRVASGSMLPRPDQFERHVQAFQLGLIDQVEMLKKSTDYDIEGVLERTGYIGQLEQALQQMQEQVKQLEGDLQTRDREAVAANKRVEVEKTKTRLARVVDKVSSDQQLARDQLNVILKEVKLDAQKRQLTEANNG